MSKRIVICSDGTGNTAVKGRGTNVFKTFEAVDLTGHRLDPKATPQVALYDDGVGTEDFKPLKLIAGITGFGLGRNVRQLYKELVRIYDEGDEIYVFGFSRGAFTVRTLVGLIAQCGIIDESKLEERTAECLDAAVTKAYRVLRQSFRTRISRLFGRRKKDGSAEFRRKYSRDHEVRIRFVGVWDTVDAVGMPFHLSDILNTTFYRFKFPDYELSAIVDRACHALALDDERHSFTPLLWDEHREKNGRIEQAWFAGAHSNVGGGYPKQGMSLVALDWMLAEASRAGSELGGEGLRLNPGDREHIRTHANADDKLYDPRAGVGVFYRWKIRDVETLCREKGVAPKVHLSVLERAAHGTEGYAPGNLPRAAQVVYTKCDAPGDEGLLRKRAANVQAVLDKACANEQQLLARHAGWIRLGLVSYYVYLISCTAVLLAAAGGDVVSAFADPSRTLSDVGHLIGEMILQPAKTIWSMARKLWDEPSLLVCLGGGFLIAYLLAWATDRALSRAFSGWWYALQPGMRKALKDARKDRSRAP